MLALVKESRKEQWPEKEPITPVKKRAPKLRKRLHENDDTPPRKPLPIDETELGLCILMWQSVIVQALYDLSANKENPDMRIWKAESAAWFLQQNTDFELVCELACLSRLKVLRMAKKVLKEGEKALEGFNFRSIRKDYSNRKATRKKTNNRGK